MPQLRLRWQRENMAAALCVLIMRSRYVRQLRSGCLPAGFCGLRTSVHEHACAEPDGLSCTYGGAGSVDGFGGLEHKHSTSLRYESGSRT